MERYKCRTCLDIVDRKRCTEISKKCLDQTIKELIILLVPAMVSTLSDDDLICKNCLRVIKSTIKFIERCLEVEMIIAENKDQDEEFENCDVSDCGENVSEVDEETILLVKPFEQVDQDHDYYVKYQPVNSDDVKIENANENYDKIDQNSESRPIEIIFDSSIVNMEDTNASSDNLPIQIIFDNSSNSYNENTSDDIPDGEVAKLENCDDTSDIPIEYINYEEEIKSDNVVENSEEFSCQTCSQEFSSKYEYDLHLEIHPAFTCNQCEKGFKTEYHYKLHLKIHESGKICEICGKMFKNDSSLNCHINEEHNKIIYMCDQCPKIFKNKFRLSGHMRMVHEKAEQQYQCQCGKLFYRKESCENHFRLVHLQLKPFVCDVCGREFGRKDYLQKHMYYHTGEPRPAQHRNKLKSRNGRGKPPKFGIRLKDPGTPVNCKICGKLILSVHLLKSHLQSHVKIKRHKCRYCELTFTLSNNRDRHQRIHEADPERKFRCNICWKKMKTEEELEHHIVGHYNRPPQHSCNICGEKFHRKYLLDNHHLDKHTDPGDIERAEKEIVIDNLLEYAHPNDLYDFYDSK